MKQLGVRFSDSAELQIKDLAESLGLSGSEVARAALSIGVQKLKLIGSNDVESAQSLVLMEDLKAKQ